MKERGKKWKKKMKESKLWKKRDEREKVVEEG